MLSPQCKFFDCITRRIHFFGKNRLALFLYMRVKRYAPPRFPHRVKTEGNEIATGNPVAHIFAGVVELVDSTDLGSVTSVVCGFESRRPHQSNIIRTGSSLWEMGSDYLFISGSLKTHPSRTACLACCVQGISFSFAHRLLFASLSGCRKDVLLRPYRSGRTSFLIPKRIEFY